MVTDVQYSDAIDYALWAAEHATGLHSALGTWRKVCDEMRPFLVLTATAWCDVGKGRKVTRRKINALRRHAGLPIMPLPVLVAPCPDCGSVHHARCNGVADPVVIVKRARPQSPAWMLEAAAWLRQHENHVAPVLRCYTRQGKPVR